jgi:predicted RecB family nuclease
VLLAKKLDSVSEMEIISTFLELITPNGENNPVVYHYSDYEPRYFKKKIESLGIQTSVNIQWVDLLSIVKSEGMYMKGCLDFSLKSYMKALGYTKTKDDIVNGNEAMVALIKYYLENDTKVIEKIKEYNLQDCKMLKVLKEKL